MGITVKSDQKQITFPHRLGVEKINPAGLGPVLPFQFVSLMGLKRVCVSIVMLPWLRICD